MALVPGADFVKAAASGQGGNCVEVRLTADSTTVEVRNSRTPDDGVLSFTRAEWDAFGHGVRAGEFDA